MSATGSNIRQMNEMKVDVEELKWFTRYHPEKQHRHSRKCKAEEKGRTLKVEKKKKPFPQELGEKLIKDAIIDDPFDFSDIQELKTLYAPAIKHCHTKQPGQSASSSATATNLELLSLKDVEELLGEVSQQQLGTVTELTMPIFRETADEEVIMDQPKRTIDNFFHKRRSYSEEVQLLPKLSEVPVAADRETQVNYSGIPMSKQLAKKLEQGKKEKPDDIATVHTSSKKNVTCGETYVDVEIDNDGNVLASNSKVNILLPNVDDKIKGKSQPDDRDVIEITDSEKESTTSKKIVQPMAAEIEAYKVTVKCSS